MKRNGRLVTVEEYLETKIARERERAEKDAATPVGNELRNFRASVVIQTLQDALAFVRQNAHR